MPRHTLICELGAHGPETEHAAVARFLHRPQRGSAWAHWAGEATPWCSARTDCPRIGEGPRQDCALFAGHPGVCTYALDSALAEDETRQRRIDDALAVLAGHTHVESETVRRAGHDSVLLAWDELRARRIWDQLAVWDQAAVLRIVSRAEIPATARDWTGIVDRLVRDTEQMIRLWAGDGTGALPGGKEAATLHEALTRLPQVWQAVVLGGQRAPKFHDSTPRTPLDEAVQAAIAQAEAGCVPPPPGPRWRTDWDDVDDRHHGAARAEGLTRLPYGWQVDAVRRIADGTDALSAGAEAGLAINMLRSYGVYLAWNARDGSR
ncbi:hypothetical protein [Streptomyces sp. NPDC058268]|uniref:hypothetical protein n=1 Tax=Streptomyces sp. NPDC058268 TaxID=3346413 RepID=UPI0036EA3315